MNRFLTLLVLSVFSLTACEKSAPTPEEKPPLTLSPASFKDLPGWQDDDLTAILPAWTRSCKRILRRSADRSLGPLEAAGTAGTWHPICRDFLALNNPSTATLRRFIESRLTPHQVAAGKSPEGLFTGYYEAHLRGSLTRHGPYQTPLHSRPDDLIMVQLGDFRDDLKGRRIAGRVKGGNLKPYENREDIVDGNWPHNDHVLLWVDDPVDAFFVQIQGSGIVELADGSTMRIGYAGQNGHPYYAIGRELIARGALTKKTVSLQSIRAWLAANPSEAAQIMNTNKSYVFFRKLDGAGPVGGEGLPLTPHRSLAIDRSLISYGLPMWLAAEHPDADKPPIQRLMITQDTGGAIRGPVRGDFFWGHGKKAEHYAGLMKSKGKYWVLLPK